MNKQIIISLIITTLLVGGAIVFTRNSSSRDASGEIYSATIIEGKQVVEIKAKGGYSPRIINAKAGIPTIVKMETTNTFDCSASLVIPEISYKKFLSPTGVEEIEISADKAQGTMQGLCSMGMYSFLINFK